MVKRGHLIRVAAALAPLLIAVTLISVHIRSGDHSDFVCYYTAGRLLLEGHSPYDLAREDHIQRALLFGAAQEPNGSSPLLPFFYPVWFALALAPLAALSFGAARVTWAVLQVAAVILTPLVLHRAAPRLAREAAIVMALLFVPFITSLAYGQVAPLLMLLAAVICCLLDRGRDRIAGVALAWLTIKPQMTAWVVVGVLLWALRRRRHGVVIAFVATLAGLTAAGTALVPGWVPAMVQSIRSLPRPTDSDPTLGISAPLLIRCLGLKGWPAAIVAVAAAAATLTVVAAWAWDRRRSALDVIGLGLLAAFAATPYAQAYDLAVLLLPMLALLGGPTGEVPRTILLYVFLILPWANRWAVVAHDWPVVSYLWMPALLGALWILRRRAPADVEAAYGDALPGPRRGGGVCPGRLIDAPGEADDPVRLTCSGASCH